MPTPLIREQAPTEALTRASIDEINRQTATNLAAQRQALVDEARAIVQDRFQEPQRIRANVEVESPFTGVEGQGDAEKQGVGEDVDIKEESEQMGQNVGQSESAFKAREEGKPISAQAFGFEEDIQTRLQRIKKEEPELWNQVYNLWKEQRQRERQRISGIGIQSKINRDLPEPQAQAQAQPVEKPKPKPKAKAKPRQDIVFEEVDEL
jgi:hypothetical protein